MTSLGHDDIRRVPTRTEGWNSLRSRVFVPFGPLRTRTPPAAALFHVLAGHRAWVTTGVTVSFRALQGLPLLEPVATLCAMAEATPLEVVKVGPASWIAGIDGENVAQILDGVWIPIPAGCDTAGRPRQPSPVSEGEQSRVMQKIERNAALLSRTISFRVQSVPRAAS